MINNWPKIQEMRSKISLAHINSPGLLQLIPDDRSMSSLINAQWLSAMGLYETLRIKGIYEIEYIGR